MRAATMWTATLLLALAAGGSSLAAKDEVVGYIGDEAVTRGEVSEKVSQQLIPLRQQEYDILAGGFNSIVNERLIAKEAEKRGVTVEALMQAEVTDKVSDPSEEEISAFYESNKARMGGRTLEQISPDITRYLRQMKENEVRSQFLDGLRAGAKVRVVLEPPRVEVPVPAGEPSMGPKDAAVTMVEFSDYQCPYCRRAQPTVDRVLETYGDRIRFVYRDYPLPMHPRATPASLAARCAGEQDKFWEYHNNLMTGAGDLSDADLESRATDLGLDIEAFKACIESGRYEATVQQGLQDGAQVGVSGTPAFFINGRHISGAQPFQVFQEILDDELARQGGSGGPDAR
ncbi:MAG: thioredoxin domain-containing protein [Acidobacteriota bacterium]